MRTLLPACLHRPRHPAGFLPEGHPPTWKNRARLPFTPKNAKEFPGHLHTEYIAASCSMRVHRIPLQPSASFGFPCQPVPGTSLDYSLLPSPGRRNTGKRGCKTLSALGRLGAFGGHRIRRSPSPKPPQSATKHRHRVRKGTNKKCCARSTLTSRQTGNSNPHNSLRSHKHALNHVNTHKKTERRFRRGQHITLVLFHFNPSPFRNVVYLTPPVLLQPHKRLLRRPLLPARGFPTLQDH